MLKILKMNIQDERRKGEGVKAVWCILPSSKPKITKPNRDARKANGDALKPNGDELIAVSLNES